MLHISTTRSAGLQNKKTCRFYRWGPAYAWQYSVGIAEQEKRKEKKRRPGLDRSSSLQEQASRVLSVEPMLT